MKIVPLTVMLAILTGPVHAQGVNLMMDQKRPLTNEDIERQKAIDEAYKSTIKKIPEQKAGDPWGNVRNSAPANPKPAATKPVATKPVATKPGASRPATSNPAKTQSSAR